MILCNMYLQLKLLLKYPQFHLNTRIKLNYASIFKWIFFKLCLLHFWRECKKWFWLVYITFFRKVQFTVLRIFTSLLWKQNTAQIIRLILPKKQAFKLLLVFFSVIYVFWCLWILLFYVLVVLERFLNNWYIRESLSCSTRLCKRRIGIISGHFWFKDTTAAFKYFILSLFKLKHLTMTRSSCLDRFKFNPVRKLVRSLWIPMSVPDWAEWKTITLCCQLKPFPSLVIFTVSLNNPRIQVRDGG